MHLFSVWLDASIPFSIWLDASFLDASFFLFMMCGVLYYYLTVPPVTPAGSLPPRHGRLLAALET